MINANGTSSKPGDWAGGGALGGGVYSEPGQRSSYDSAGRQLTNFQGQDVAGTGSGWGNSSSSSLSGSGGKGSTGLGGILGGGGKGQPASSTGTAAPNMMYLAPSTAVTPPKTPFTPTAAAPFNSSAWQDANRLTPDYIAQKVAAAQARMSNWAGGPQNGWGGPLSGIGSSGQPTANQAVNQGSYSKAQGPLGAGWADRVPQQATYKGFNNPW
jgi:hypothetical protein